MIPLKFFHISQNKSFNALSVEILTYPLSIKLRSVYNVLVDGELALATLTLPSIVV